MAATLSGGAIGASGLASGEIFNLGATGITAAHLLWHDG